jgi:hypothetical protein
MPVSLGWPLPYRHLPHDQQKPLPIKRLDLKLAPMGDTLCIELPGNLLPAHPLGVQFFGSAGKGRHTFWREPGGGVG